MQEFKLKHLLLKLYEITISYHSSGVNTLQSHFMYKNLKSFVSRCECVSCFDNMVVNPEERFTHDAAQKKLGSCFLGRLRLICLLSLVLSLRLCFRICKNPGLSQRGSYYFMENLLKT